VKKQKKNLKIFIVVGRLGRSLTMTKTLPVIRTGKTDKIWIFREEEGFPIEGAQYITLPKWLIRLKPAFLKRILRFVYEPFQLYKYSIKFKPDIINGIYTLPKGLNSVIVGKFTGKLSIVSVIGGTIEITTRLPFERFWKWLNLTMLRHADAVSTTGTLVENYLIENGIKKEKQFIYPGCIDENKFKIDPKIKRDIDILFVGTLRKLKGPDRILKVILNLLNEGMQIKASFLGSGYMLNELKQIIEENNLNNSVTIHGHVDNPVEYFQRAKVLLMPSTSEGLPMAMLEAMACGCVPVVSNVGNITDAARNGENALVIDHWNDIPSFTSAAKKIINDDNFRKKLSYAGRQAIENKYTPEKQAVIIREMFKYLNL